MLNDLTTETLQDYRTGRTVHLKVLIANQAGTTKTTKGIINEDKQVLAFRAH